MGSVIHLASTADAPGESAGEPQTFEAFFTEQRRALSSYLRRRMASEAAVQEVVQESYARILSYGYGCSSPPPVWKALLYRIVPNLAYPHGRVERARTSARHMPQEDVADRKRGSARKRVSVRV